MDLLPGIRDVFGQLPRLKGYIYIVVCLPVDDISQYEARDAIQKASSCLVVQFPWLAGQVIHQGVDHENSGFFTIDRGHKGDDAPYSMSTVREKDLSDAYSYEYIIQKNGPTNLLDGSLLSNETSLPDSYGE